MGRHKTESQERLFQLEFGMRVALVRNIRKVSQAQLAKEIGLVRASVANIETGRQGVDLWCALQIAKALNVRLGKLLPNIILVES